jgi:hypothetical protein
MKINKVYIKNTGAYEVSIGQVKSIYFYGSHEWIKVIFSDNKIRLFPRESIVEIEATE